MIHSLRERATMASKDTFPLTPAKCLITSPNPSSKPAVKPCPPKSSYDWRQTYSTSLYAATPSRWTTSSGVLVYAPHPFEERTPTALSWLHNKIQTPSTDRPIYWLLQADLDPWTRPILTSLKNCSPYPSIPSFSRC